MNRPCPVCDAETPHRKVFVKKSKDYLRCRGCGLIIVDPIPSLDEMKRYYDTDYEGDSGMGVARTSAEFLFHATARSRVPKIAAHRGSGGRWLDVGCANGAFLEVIVDAGYDAHGIDLSANAVEIARGKGLQVRAATLEDCRDDAPYDVVSAFDVIEHVLDPASFVRSAHQILELGGIFAVTTPDTKSIMARVMRSRWYEYIPETHFFNFDRASLRRLLERCGFEVMAASRAKKHLNFEYGQIQFEAYNPVIHKLLGAVGRLLPRSVQRMPISFYIGEMLMIARKVGAPAA